MYINHAINNSISSFRRDIFSRARLLQETYPTSSVNPTSVSIVNVPAFKRFRKANNEYGVLAYDESSDQEPVHSNRNVLDTPYQTADYALIYEDQCPHILFHTANLTDFHSCIISIFPGSSRSYPS